MEAAAEFSMMGSAIDALLIILDPVRFLYLAGAVMIGLCIGLLPGIGGLTGFALLLPFTFTMEPYTAYACLLGMASVINTSDTIPAVLLGVPGTAASQATVLDGLSMTKKGEAGRALAAAYTASMMGGVFGAALLAFSIPIVKPFVLAVGSPELFAMTLVAISMVSSLSGSVPLRGMVAACFGIALSMIGSAPQTGSLRWTFGTLYLWDGLPLLPIILGIFALPELCDLAIRKTSQFEGEVVADARKGMAQGIGDAFRNWFLVIRCASMGSAIGAIPGLSGSVVDWLAYGHALKTVRGAKDTFGQGDVRGVIAPESANNATEGGGLIPTLAFGVPGSASMALLIGALMIHGITPGPEMLTTNLSLTYSMMWSIAIANIVGAGICLALSPQFAKLSMMRYTLILPAILTVVYIGAFQGSRAWGDLYALLGFGVLGWLMKRLKWPRPPLVLGFVLGVLIERYLAISISRYGMEWLTRPVVAILLLLAVLTIARPFFIEVRRRGLHRLKPSLRPQFRAPDLMYVAFIALFAYLGWQTIGWRFDVLIGPRVIAISALIFATVGLLNQLFLARNPEGLALNTETFMDLTSGEETLDRKTVFLRGLRFFGWLVGFMGGLATVGILITVPVFVVAFMRLEAKERWNLCLIYAAVLTLFVYGLFDQTLHLYWPRTYLGTQFPDLGRLVPTM